MKLPSDPLARLERTVSPLLHTSFLGIDIGTSSIKIVQLSMEGGAAVLDTYGEIELGPYADHEARKTAHLDPPQQAAALMDLLHAVEATARIGGIAIPLPSALISFVKMPRRDPEQMRRIVPEEAKQYVPVPMERVILDWLAVSDDAPAGAGFSRAESNAPATIELQDVMLIAVEKATVAAYESCLDTAGLGARFYEVELFSSIRSFLHPPGLPTLLIDIGASASKLSVINGRGLPRAVHLVPHGGQAMTERIMHACAWEFEKAEDAKRAAGLLGAAAYSAEENTAIKGALDDALSELFTESSRIIAAAGNEHDVEVSRIELIGGGALMPGIVAAAAGHFGKSVELADPFAHVRKPIILAETIRAAGPAFATAIGLALRGLTLR